METTERDLDDIEEGEIIYFDEELCLVESTSTSSGGKHGTAKVNLELTKLADGSETLLNQPEDSTVETVAVQDAKNPVIYMADDSPHFDPAGVRIPEGKNVVWLWNDDTAHKLVGDEGNLESDRNTGVGFTFEYTFDEPGAYTVTCAEHGETCLIVVEAAAEEDA